VIFSSGLGNVGADRVMDFIIDYTPAPSEHEWVQGEAGRNGDAPKRHESDEDRCRCMCFARSRTRLRADFVLQVFSGVLKNDATLLNFSRGGRRSSRTSRPAGKTAIPVPNCTRAYWPVAKLKDTSQAIRWATRRPIQYPRVKLPEPAITFAIEPKSRADEDKLGPGLHKLMEEDAMLRFFAIRRRRILIAGTGQQHIEVVVRN